MQNIQSQHQPKRKSINLTIREDIIREARELELNASKAAEAGILKAIKETKEQIWLAQNQDAIKAYNEEIKKRGPSLKPQWLKDLSGSV